jgi:glycosyltransferase involved in cell wall biosynthesis
MKIVHVLPALTKGGAERVTAELANHAVRMAHAVTIVAGYAVDSSLLREALHPSVNVRYVSEVKSGRLGNYCSLVRWIWRHRAWIYDQDVLHCHLTYGSVFGALVGELRSLARRQRPAIVQTYHSVGMAIPRLNRWLHARLAARHDAVALMVRHPYWTKFFAKHPGLRAKIIPNGLSRPGVVSPGAAERLGYRREVGIPDKCKYVVGTIGMLRSDRRPWIHLPVFARIAETMDLDVHFVVFGEGPELSRMRSLILDHGLEGRVHLPGLAATMQMPLSIIDLYIAVNVESTTGMAAIEAALSGVPIIGIQMSPDYKAAPEDWIWSSPELSEVATRAVSLLRSQLDLQRLAEQQTEYAETHHSVEAMAASYYDFYETAREQRHAPRFTSPNP